MLNNAYPKPDQIEIRHLLDATADNNTVGLTVFDSKMDISKSIYNRPFRSLHFSVILVKKGQLSVSVDVNRFVLEEMDLLIIPPSAIRIFELQKPETEFISLLFTADFLLQAGLHIKYYPRFSLGEKTFHSTPIFNFSFTFILFKGSVLPRRRIIERPH